MLDRTISGKKSPEAIDNFFDSFKESPQKASGTKDLSNYEMELYDEEFEANPTITRNLFNTAPKTSYSPSYPIKKRLLYQNDFEDDEDDEDEVLDGFLNLNNRSKKENNLGNAMKIGAGANYNSNNKKTSSINLEEKLNSYSKQIMQELEESNKKKELEEKMLEEKKNMSLEESIQQHANERKVQEAGNDMEDVISEEDSDYSEPLVEDQTGDDEAEFGNNNANYDPETNSNLPSPYKKLKTEKDSHYLGYNFKPVNPMVNPMMNSQNPIINRQNNSGTKLRLLDEISTTNKNLIQPENNLIKMNSGSKINNDKRKNLNDLTNLNHSNNKLKNLANGIFNPSGNTTINKSKESQEVFVEPKVPNQNSSNKKENTANDDQNDVCQNFSVYWDMFLQSGKSPVIFLNEFANKIEKKIDYQFNICTVNKKQSHQCQISLESFGVICQKEWAENKIDSKNIAAKKALYNLLNKSHQMKKIFPQILEKQLRSDNTCNKSEFSDDESQISTNVDDIIISTPTKDIFDTVKIPLDISSVDELYQKVINESNYNNGYNYSEYDPHKQLLIFADYAAKTKEPLKWRFKIMPDTNFTMSEITIGNIIASNVNKHKSISKMNAAKNLLRTIYSNNIWKEKFNFYLRETSFILTPTKNSQELENSNQNNLNYNLSNNKPGFSQANTNNTSYQKSQNNNSSQKKSYGDNYGQNGNNKRSKDDKDPSKSSELKNWFVNLYKRIEPNENQKACLRTTFIELNEIISFLFNNTLKVKLLPIGSFLIGCYREKKLEADCILHNETDLSEIPLEKVKMMFEEKRSYNYNFNNNGTTMLSNKSLNNYECSLIKSVDGSEECLTFTQVQSNVKLNIFRFNDSHISYECHESGKTINKHNSLIYHALWLDENLMQAGVSEDIIKILMIVREWNEKQELKIPSEILDLAAFYCTFNFKESEIVKVLLKFFSLQNLLITKYNFYFYELSDYHAYLIKNLNEGQRKMAIIKAQKTFQKLANNNPSDFI